MITLTAKISLLSSNSGSLDNASTNLLGNNISGDINAILGQENPVRNPFIIGKNKIGDGSTFSNGENYFIGSQLSNENKVFETPYEITIKGKNIEVINIAFDTANHRHPTWLTIENIETGYTEQYDVEGEYFTTILDGANEYKITIRDWTEANSFFILSGLYINININVDYKSLINLSRTIYDRSDLKLPSFGIISNVGNLEFNDFDGKIKQYAEVNLLTSEAECEIYINNTLVENASEQIALMETDKWDYDSDNKIVNVSLKDDLEEWQEINVEGINYDPRVVETKTCQDIYKYLYNITQENYNMQNFGELDTETQTIIRNTKMKHYLLQSGSLWQQWTKLCEVCQLHIYKNNNGLIVCRYNGGN